MEKSISSMIHILFARIQKIGESQIGSFDMTPAQVRILMFIGKRAERGEKTFQKDIEHEFGIKGSSVTSIINNLEKHKWVRRESVDYDARLKSIVFAENTYEAMECMGRMSERFDNYMKETLTDAEFIVFCQCVEKIINTLEEKRDDVFDDSFRELLERGCRQQ